MPGAIGIGAEAASDDDLLDFLNFRFDSVSLTPETVRSSESKVDFRAVARSHVPGNIKISFRRALVSTPSLE